MITPLKIPIVEPGMQGRIAGLASRQTQAASRLASRQAQVAALVVDNSTRQEPAAPAMSEAQSEASMDDSLSAACWELIAHLHAEISPEQRAVLSRVQLAKIVGSAIDAYLLRHAMNLGKFTRRDLVTNIMRALLAPTGGEPVSSNRRTHLRAVEAAKAA